MPFLPKLQLHDVNKKQTWHESVVRATNITYSQQFRDPHVSNVTFLSSMMQTEGMVKDVWF